MARIEDLIDEIPDPGLRNQIAAEVKHLKSSKRFGLVYEEHVPETVSLSGLSVRPGSIVQKRREPGDQTRWEVASVDDATATIIPVGGSAPAVEIPVRDLLTVKRFEEPIYPGLTPAGQIRRGPADKPYHSVISGENYHALQLLAYTHAGKIDVIYIDPPYNTGDKSWRYNNRFVDGNDAYRHSKWLAMMEKRLKLAKTLLKPKGVLIVTIDEHEVHHLGLLLDGLFGEYLRQMVTVVINPKGVAQQGLARVEEYAIYVMPGGEEVVTQLPVDMLRDAVLTPVSDASPWISLLRRGSHSRPSERPNMCFPVAVDERGRITNTGRTLRQRISAGEVVGERADQWRPPKETIDGHAVMWPFRSDGALGVWGVGSETLLRLVEDGHAKVSGFEAAAQRGVIQFLSQKARRRILAGEIVQVGSSPDGSVELEIRHASRRTPQRVWHRASHDAGTFGSSLLAAFLGRPRAFSFPKSIYATADALDVILANRPRALVLDFFAGSGTTLHSVALLNARDGGNRQCLLVTNNDVSDTEATALSKAGFFVGDPEYEAQGIFDAVTHPRVEAAIMGIRSDGEPVEGSYLDQYLPNHAYADGFDENVAFFRMDYLEPDLVELGRQYQAIAPLLWMAAGSVGSWEPWDGTSAWSAPQDSSYAVLFDVALAAAFGEYIESRSGGITHIWIVTDSHSAFLDAQAELPEHLMAGQLYRDYLRNFVVNAPGVVR